jgi:branched-chain amino acid transport system substrate-binding protein
MVAACLASACGSDEKRPAVKVGVLLPYTGDSAAVGGSLERAVVLAIESVNRGSGLGGKDLSSVFADTRSDPEQAIGAVDQLLAEDIQALIGPESFEIADRILPRLKERGVLFLSPYLSDSIEYPSADNWPWFRLAPTATVMGEALAKRLWLDGHPSSAFVFTRDRYCLDFADAAMRRYQELGGTVTWKRGLEPAEVSYAADVRDSPAADTSAVALVALPLAAARLVTDVFVALPKVHWQWYLAPHLKTPAFLENTVASVVEGAIGVAPQATADPQFAQAYQNRFLHEQPLPSAVGSALGSHAGVRARCQRDNSGRAVAPIHSLLATGRTSVAPDSHLHFGSSASAFGPSGRHLIQRELGRTKG